MEESLQPLCSRDEDGKIRQTLPVFPLQPLGGPFRFGAAGHEPTIHDDAGWLVAAAVAEVTKSTRIRYEMLVMFSIS